MVTKDTNLTLTPIVGIPSYVHRSIRPLITRRHIELRAVREMREDRLPEESFAACICTINDKRYKYIETPEDVENVYYANCALLHEIGHLCTKNIFLMPTYKREVKAWKHAEKLRNKIGFPQRDLKTGMSWDEAKECSLSSYAGAKLKKSDFTSLIKGLIIRYITSVIMIGLTLLAIYCFTASKANPNWFLETNWIANLGESAKLGSFFGIFRTFKGRRNKPLQRFAARWNSEG